VLADRRQNGRVVDAETLARQLRAEARVKNDRIAPLERLERKLPLLTLGDKPVRRIEPGEVVKEACEARATRVFMMTLGQAIGETRHANRMCEALVLADVRAYVAGERAKTQRPPAI